jgi:hypothetical protein
LTLLSSIVSRYFKELQLSKITLFDVCNRTPTPHILRELARVLELDYDTLLASAGAADVVVREYLEVHPQQTEAIIKLFRAAQQSGFKDWERLRKIIEQGRKASR